MFILDNFPINLLKKTKKDTEKLKKLSQKNSKSPLLMSKSNQ